MHFDTGRLRKVLRDYDLAPETRGPEYGGPPMMFLGQVNLAEVASFGLSLLREGLLSFFYDIWT
ncbi:DUF1963 domain-containing protein [Corallococcus exiguus]|nr:DUF1963 domain-containing protein [Corallococcus exiguus]